MSGQSTIHLSEEGLKNLNTLSKKEEYQGMSPSKVFEALMQAEVSRSEGIDLARIHTLLLRQEEKITEIRVVQKGFVNFSLPAFEGIRAIYQQAKTLFPQLQLPKWEKMKNRSDQNFFNKKGTTKETSKKQ